MSLNSFYVQWPKVCVCFFGLGFFWGGVKIQVIYIFTSSTWKINCRGYFSIDKLYKYPQINHKCVCVYFYFIFCFFIYFFLFFIYFLIVFFSMFFFLFFSFLYFLVCFFFDFLFLTLILRGELKTYALLILDRAHRYSAEVPIIR